MKSACEFNCRFLSAFSRLGSTTNETCRSSADHLPGRPGDRVGKVPLDPAADEGVGGADLQMAVGHRELRGVLEPYLVTLGADLVGDPGLD